MVCAGTVDREDIHLEATHVETCAVTQVQAAIWLRRDRERGSMDNHGVGSVTQVLRMDINVAKQSARRKVLAAMVSRCTPIKCIICVGINTNFSLLTQIPSNGNNACRVLIREVTSWHDSTMRRQLLRKGE